MIQKDDYVSLVRIPRNWFHIFVLIFSTSIIVNTICEFLYGWAWEELGETTLTRNAVLMTLIVGWFFITAHLWGVIMLGYAKLFKEKVFNEGKAEGKAEAEAEAEVKIEELIKEFEEAERNGMSIKEAVAQYKLKNGEK